MLHSSMLICASLLVVDISEHDLSYFFFTFGGKIWSSPFFLFVFFWFSVWDWKEERTEVSFEDARSLASKSWMVDNVCVLYTCSFSLCKETHYSVLVKYLIRVCVQRKTYYCFAVVSDLWDLATAMFCTWNFFFKRINWRFII